jgi:hypothetical protein
MNLRPPEIDPTLATHDVSGFPEVHHFIGTDQNRLVSPLVLIQLETVGSLTHLPEDLRSRDGRGVNYNPVLVDAEGVVFGMWRTSAVLLRVLLKLHDFKDFNHFDQFWMGLFGALMLLRSYGPSLGPTPLYHRWLFIG